MGSTSRARRSDAEGGRRKVAVQVMAVLSLLLASSCSVLFRVDDIVGGTGDASTSADASLGDAFTSADASLGDALASEEASRPTAGLLAHWAFDEGSGTVAKDDSPNALHGTVAGATWTTGKIGQALLFDGVNDYVATSTASPPVTSTYTVSLWVRLDATIPAGARQVLARSDSSTLVLDAGPEDWRFHWNDSPSTTDELFVDRSNDVGVWHHLAATHDGAKASLYVDHVLAGSKDVVSNSYDGKRFNIGADVLLSTRHMRGAIDDVRVYTRALSRDEIELL